MWPLLRMAQSWAKVKGQVCPVLWRLKILIQEHAYCTQPHSVQITSIKAPWYSFQFHVERHWKDVFIYTLYVYRASFPLWCLWGQRFLFRNEKENAITAEIIAVYVIASEWSSLFKGDCLSHLAVSECTSGLVTIREAIVLLSPHSHKLVNGHEARPVASSWAEQWHFPVEGTLTGLWRQGGRRNGVVCDQDLEKIEEKD